MARIKVTKLRHFCFLILKKAGVPAEHAGIMADALVEADLLGVKTHGTSRLNLYLGHIEHNTINPSPKFKILSETPSITVIDADKAMGPVAGDYAIKIASGKAKKTGVGVSSVRNSSHMGALSVTAKKVTQEKLLGIVISNTSPIMAPWGGGEPTLGNNPIAISIPTKKDYPYILDMALSITARGNIILAAREGKKIPEGWALNRDGEPTIDPEEALLGSVLPLAQHKGYGLAFMFDVLCGVLSGAAFGKKVGSFVPPDYDKPLNMGHFLLVLDIEKFMPYDEYIVRIEEYVNQIKNSKKATSFNEILIPGERSHKKYLENFEKGIELPPTTLDLFSELGKKYQVELDFN